MKIRSKLLITYLTISIVPALFISWLVFHYMQNLLVDSLIVKMDVPVERHVVIKEFEEPLRHALYFYWVLFTGYILAVGIVIISTAKSIADPINKLTEMTDDISRGKLDVRLESIEGKDEIGDLARAFDRILISLKLAMRGSTKSKLIKWK
ncbi:MAG: HAMP domain-containing protein [Patescibacteria group bacterium]|nr:HAMP domain-containing protein [Patescibacteria group bacterium]MBU2509401.1 HAMP domain-containing protein [Patescibacteria group bacterium]